MGNIAFQHELRPVLPNVYGTLDYREFREVLEKIDDVLIKSDLEHEVASQALNDFAQRQSNPNEFLRSDRATFHYNQFMFALRCNIARHLTGESYRKFSIRLADSTLLQWFTRINAFGNRKPISKSTLERFEKLFDQEYVAEKIREWLSKFSNGDIAISVGLNKSIDFSTVLMDTTCIKANIHFPVDWILLRDASRSLLSAIITIRNQGLKNRIIDPKILMKQMNNLCIEMTNARRKKDSKKIRKATLRKMKKLVNTIKKHACRYRDILSQEFDKTNWTERQAQQVIDRINSILEQLPAAIKQAHDRIIGERQIESADKILSLYDKDVEVIVRGKAGSEVEFGQRLILSEQEDGLIIDWELFSEKGMSDSDLAEPTINRIEERYGKINSVCADRGFGNIKLDSFLKEKNIYNGVCPKSPNLLKERLKEKQFSKLQTRRSQTEARIGIFSNVFLGKPLRSRITEYKRHTINWCVLTHNLWVIARKAIADEKAMLKKAA
jgi:hypothetical protein